jgi:hypothetical protein
MEQNSFEKVMVAQVFKKFCIYCGTKGSLPVRDGITNNWRKLHNEKLLVLRRWLSSGL